MAQAIVHSLEAVNVDKNNMKIFGIGLGALALQTIHEQGAVGKAGYPVINRIIEKTFLGSFCIGYVRQGADAAHHAVVGTGHGAGAQLKPAVGSVARRRRSS